MALSNLGTLTSSTPVIRNDFSITPSDPTKVAEAVEILKKLEPGFLPLPLFLEISRLVTTPVIEVVPLRETFGKIEVLLLERDKDDPTWPGLIHTPGTVLRSTDSKGTIQDALDRILERELKGVKIRNTPSFVGFWFHQVKRGAELALVHWVEVISSSIGKFYSVDDLPTLLIDTQVPLINLAVELSHLSV